MKRILTVILAAAALMTACKPGKPVEMVVETTMGNFEIKLYDETPRHRDNFIKLVRQHYYDSLLFHRVIADFMIQTGDPDSKYAEPMQQLGSGGPGWTVPAEFCVDKGIYHKRGALAAARLGDRANPRKASSGSQFYIVWGSIFDDEGLDEVQQMLDQNTGGTVKLTPGMRETYQTIGGTPHLDGQYTVFGEVTRGLEVIDAIQQTWTDLSDRPVEDIRILKIYRKK